MVQFDRLSPDSSGTCSKDFSELSFTNIVLKFSIDMKQPHPPQTKSAIYCRVSTYEQAKAISVRWIAMSNARQYCEAKGYVVYDVYRDTGERYDIELSFSKDSRRCHGTKG